jgi:hypothetical protein
MIQRSRLRVLKVFGYGGFEFKVLTLVPAIFGTFEAVSVKQKLIRFSCRQG